MALVMVQGHVMDTLLDASGARPSPGTSSSRCSTARRRPGFLFASGFVAGLPRAPLSLRAGLRRARRLLFVLGVGYYLHLPYFSLWKTLGGSTSRGARAALRLRRAAGDRGDPALRAAPAVARRDGSWTRWAGVLALAVVAATPFVWASGVAARLPGGARTLARRGDRLALPASFRSRPSCWPARSRARSSATRDAAAAPPARGRVGRCGLAGPRACVLAVVLRGRVDFWGPSPAYVFVRLGGLLLLLRLVEAARPRGACPGIRALALLGHETLLVYVLHLTLLFGGVFGPSPLTRLARPRWASRAPRASCC